MIEFFVIALVIVTLIDFSLRTPRYRGPRSDHFNGRHFHSALLGSIHLFEVKHPLVERHPRTSFFIKKLRSTWQRRELEHGQAVPAARIDGRKIVLTYVNHSTMLIQTEGLNILTDPIWADRASPFTFIGPHRYMDPGIAIDKLPKIDIILQSHNHYDHMDIVALQKICKRDHPRIYTPLGNSAYLSLKHISGSVDMDWGETRRFSDHISISCVPSQHFSGRSLSDMGRALWGGFVIHTPHGDIYFAGDTGYGPFVSHIKKAYPKGFRLALLPIGAFEPRTFMQRVHIGPDEAIEMYKELKVKEAVAIHFGTFDLALDRQDDPVSRLLLLLSEDANRDVHFRALTNGGSHTIE